jgi:hypothetical protein
VCVYVYIYIYVYYLILASQRVVSLALVASFKRMKILHASVQDIAEAARAVPFLEVLAHHQALSY